MEKIEALIEATRGNLLKKFNQDNQNIKQIIFIVKMKHGTDDMKAIKKIKGADKIYTV